MESKNVGVLIQEARIHANLTQEQLAHMIAGLSANEIDRAERGQLRLKQAHLRLIAKATGVTQSSLINAAKGNSSVRASDRKNASKKQAGFPVSDVAASATENEKQANTAVLQSNISAKSAERRPKTSKVQRIRFLKTPGTPYRMALMCSRQKMRRSNAES